VPSILHEALVALFRNRPSLAPELLRDALHVEVPDWSEIRFENAELSEVVPAESRADLVLLRMNGCLPSARVGFLLPGAEYFASRRATRRPSPSGPPRASR
jgi:hypothetical protein